jgi:hypothetical protein
MAGKKHTEEVQDVDVFPENYTMNSWDNDTPEMKIEKERGRSMGEKPRHQKLVHEGTFYIRPEWKIPGMQMAWIMERLMNETKTDNIEKAYHNGWRFVKKEECPWMQIEEMDGYESRGRSDGLVRKGGMILMKKSLEDYLEDQEEHRLEGEYVRKQSAELTGYLGNHEQPRFTVENSGNYTPNYRHRG